MSKEANLVTAAFLPIVALRGSTASLTLSFNYRDNKEPLNLTGAVVVLDIIRPMDNAVVASFTNGQGLTVGASQITITTFEQIPVGGFRYRATAVFPNGRREPILLGPLTIR